MKQGEQGCVARARDNFLPKLEDLGRFEYVAPDGRDLGINVRHRAQAIGVLLRCALIGHHLVSHWVGLEVRRQGRRAHTCHYIAVLPRCVPARLLDTGSASMLLDVFGPGAAATRAPVLWCLVV